ncbi:MAG: 5-amino-6-(D-ribitylamino)uracil--L-tyrosine 4-hydroxyphenyl transferase CofH, partial [Alphaproteobacteria bacterium]
CHYCAFAQPPRAGEHAFLPPKEVRAIALAGAAHGCKEALFTLGDKPELRYALAEEELRALGHGTTAGYLEAMARLVLDETGLLPHANPGVMGREDIQALRAVSVSQGMMLESASARLCQRGGPHHGSPDKHPSVRLRTIAAAGQCRVPYTSGILIGIGETRAERIDALLALRDLHDRFGHIQEIIIQNFRRKPGTRMADAPEPSLGEHVWTIAVARVLFGPEMNIQAPPNLRPGALGELIGAGINDWGGVSPVTPDHVNPEAPWPNLRELELETARHGKALVERLAIYPGYVRDRERWLDPALARRVLDARDSEGLARDDRWSAGVSTEAPRRPAPAPALALGRRLGGALERAVAGERLNSAQIEALFSARGAAVEDVCRAADHVRRALVGDTVTYVVNRNINYTNICYFHCGFCAFSKSRAEVERRERAYDLGLDEIARRAAEAWARGATEVCLQGGIHPDYTGDTYLGICRAIKSAVPGIHIHAFSPLEVWQGAETLGLTLDAFLAMLREAGLSSLPGTAAEVLDDRVRAVICPDKLSTGQWLEVVRSAHRLGFRTTATIMFGHVDGPPAWANHLLAIRALQEETGGFTEFVPLPFVPHEAPIYRKGRARPGPTFREAMLMHAVARLALNPVIPNIQASWVKLGLEGVAAVLDGGANDVGGTLMNESITRAAGARHGQELSPARIEALVASLGRIPLQRTTLYAPAPSGRVSAAKRAPPLEPTGGGAAMAASRKLGRPAPVRPAPPSA